MESHHDEDDEERTPSSSRGNGGVGGVGGAPAAVIGHQIQCYFRETTVHGFRYVVEGQTAAERAVWVVLIAAAFAFSAYLADSAVREAKENPISTSIEIVPIQDMAFPSVTVDSEVHQDNVRGHDGVNIRLVVDVLNSLEFDCHRKDAACMDRTRNLRQDFRPMLANAVEVYFDLTKAAVKQNLYEDVFEYFKQERPNGEPFPKSVIREFCSVEVEGRKEEVEGAFLKMLLDNFRAPKYQFQNESLKFAKRFKAGVPRKKISECEHEDLPEVVHAMIRALIFLSGQFGMDRELPFGDLYALAYYSELAGWYFPARIALSHPAYGNVADVPDRIVNSLLLSDDDDDDDAGDDDVGVAVNDFFSHVVDDAVVSVRNMSGRILRRVFRCSEDYMSFIGLQAGGCFEDTACCRGLKTEVSRDLRRVLKVMKHARPSAGWSIRNPGHLRDIETAARSLNYSRRRCSATERSPSERCFHSDPRIHGCRFGSRERIDWDCTLFRETVSTEGLSYTFNDERYWDLYRAGEYTEAFYEEVYRTTEKEEDDGRPGVVYPRRPPINGLSFGLKFHLRPELIHFYKGSTPSYKVAIHDPKMLAENFVELSPGMKHTILVTPSMITSDGAVLQLDEEDKKCRNPDELRKSKHDLGLFKSYTQSGCLFQCRLERAFAYASCIPWDFPHFDRSAVVCRATDARAFKDHFNLPPENCDCPNDCNSTSYSFSVISEPVMACPPSDDDSDSYPADAEMAEIHELLFFLMRPAGTTRRCEEEARRVAKVSIHLAPLSVPNIRRLRRTTFTDQMASLGGVIGLFTGMSILSFMEVLVWLGKITLWRHHPHSHHRHNHDHDDETNKDEKCSCQTAAMVEKSEVTRLNEEFRDN